MAGSGYTRNQAQLAGIVVALHAIYLNLDQAKGSEWSSVAGGGPSWGPPHQPPPLPPQLGGAIQGFLQQHLTGGDYGRDNYRNNAGYYDDLLANRRGYDLGKMYAGGHDYSRSGIQGGGFKDLGGRNKGHTAQGFSTSYRKDESGDKSSYYDDGLGHVNKIKYGGQDTRFRDVGGGTRRGGYQDSNLNRGAEGQWGRYGDSYHNRGYSGGYGGGNGGWIYDRGYRHGRLYSQPSILTYAEFLPTTTAVPTKIVKKKRSR